VSKVSEGYLGQTTLNNEMFIRWMSYIKEKPVAMTGFFVGLI